MKNKNQEFSEYEIYSENIEETRNSILLRVIG
jgi:hypothetical protein